MGEHSMEFPEKVSNVIYPKQQLASHLFTDPLK